MRGYFNKSLQRAEILTFTWLGSKSLERGCLASRITQIRSSPGPVGHFWRLGVRQLHVLP